ncbi:hypothetical protein [Aquimarina algiphila]|uniref:Uncharacterized protein n=1 Tax=Aquimarina algiphila TaxID=2047982 RepID=A0A554VBP7_9FLAO|nr:hypothetical protein [Aquimarina algiphila]TSE04005.1 hypothetical protein FOF46_27850 [Aquimarina algiphila]
MKQKIILTFNKEELNKFEEALGNSGINKLSELVTLVISKDNPEKYITRKVKEALSDLSGFEIEFITLSHNLKTDLGLTNYHKKSLKFYFQRIVKDLDSKKAVTVQECEKLTKVSDCIKLIKSKI